MPELNGATQDRAILRARDYKLLFPCHPLSQIYPFSTDLHATSPLPCAVLPAPTDSRLSGPSLCFLIRNFVTGSPLPLARKSRPRPFTFAPLSLSSSLSFLFLPFSTPGQPTTGQVRSRRGGRPSDPIRGVFAGDLRQRLFLRGNLAAVGKSFCIYSPVES